MSAPRTSRMPMDARTDDQGRSTNDLVREMKRGERAARFGGYTVLCTTNMGVGHLGCIAQILIEAGLGAKAGAIGTTLAYALPVATPLVLKTVADKFFPPKDRAEIRQRRRGTAFIAGVGLAFTFALQTTHFFPHPFNTPAAGNYAVPFDQLNLKQRAYLVSQIKYSYLPSLTPEEVKAWEKQAKELDISTPEFIFKRYGAGVLDMCATIRGNDESQRDIWAGVNLAP